MRCLNAVVTLGFCTLLNACVIAPPAPQITPAQQHAMDQQTCAGYGFQPGSDNYANCMMQTAHRRDDSAQAAQDKDEYIRQLSIQRNGDTRFPICGTETGKVDKTTTHWYGPNCRQQ